LEAVSPDLTVRALRVQAKTLGLEANDANALLTHVLGKSRTWLAAHDSDPLPPEHYAQIQAAFSRRAAGEPIAYITGEREFFSRSFLVTPAVLIPRPETEALVEFALTQAQNGAKILDICTGSGCVAISIACERADLTVYASDLSESALTVARSNAARLAARVQWRQGDLFAPWVDENFALIVANPPYIAVKDHHLQQGDLRFEPPMALTDYADGLQLISALIAQSLSHLEPGGILALEHGFDQAPVVRNLMGAAGYTQIQSITDLAGHERITHARR
jgi:release factor glutamine methyltransferase